ncbi:MAG TPA: hypothetical protein ENJ56_06505, partial [Anaerolineae bacterium]|nr:hypothetical protein [Anaerolineae bacterium]
MRAIWTFLITVLVLLVVGGVVSAETPTAIVYVNVAATGANNGTSWADAYTDPVTALAAISTGEVWIAAGIYTPTAQIQLKNNVMLYGGFVGNETSLSERDIVANETVFQSGASIINGSNTDASAVVDGITIQNGVGSRTDIAGEGGAGGGVFIDNGSPTFINCTIKDNQAQFGSGVFIRDGSPTFINCSFISNISTRSGIGGAIYADTLNTAEQQLIITNSLFNYNTVWQGAFTTGHGAGIYAASGVTLSVQKSNFYSNWSWHNNTFGNATTGGAIAALGP